MSWEQLLAIRAEAVDISDHARTEVPSACPTDGEPLTSGPAGKLFCPFCGWAQL